LVPDSLARQILGSIGARAVAIKMGQQRRLLASADLPAAIDHDIDMRTMTPWSAIVGSFETMLESGNQAIRIIGPAPRGAQFIGSSPTSCRCVSRCTGSRATSCWFRWRLRF
jgi:hypothetical protein